MSALSLLTKPLHKNDTPARNSILSLFVSLYAIIVVFCLCPTGARREGGMLHEPTETSAPAETGQISADRTRERTPETAQSG